MEGVMEREIKNEGGKLPYKTPTVVFRGTLEAITRQDIDGKRFDLSFNAGDTIPPAFSS
jgi:hypothetical protein